MISLIKLHFVHFLVILFICNHNFKTVASDVNRTESSNILSNLSLSDLTKILGPLDKPIGKLLSLNISFTLKQVEKCYNGLIGNDNKPVNIFDIDEEFSNVVKKYYVSFSNF